MNKDIRLDDNYYITLSEKNGIITFKEKITGATIAVDISKYVISWLKNRASGNNDS